MPLKLCSRWFDSRSASCRSTTFNWACARARQAADRLLTVMSVFTLTTAVLPLAGLNVRLPVPRRTDWS